MIISIDDTEKKRWFQTSEVEELRGLFLTEAELYATVQELYPVFSLERIMLEGARTLARRKIAEAHSDRMRGMPTRPGSADKRLQRAFDRLNSANEKAKAAGKPLRKVTAYTLSEAANPPTSWRTAARWIKDNVQGADPDKS